MTPPKNPRILLRSFCLIVHLSLMGLFWYAYKIRYFNHVDCFNSEGRCYIPGEGVLTTSGAFWGVFAILFAALALFTALRLTLALIRNRHGTHRQG